MDKFVGKRLDGRYELLELIGSGGMANVYKARDVVDDSTVAVKILRDEYAKNTEFQRRFKNESKAIALLSHPNIVRVSDVSFGDLLQYIVMEYISGVTLKEYIAQQGALTWKETVHFTVQILRALQHAHDNGIVHRDIKPQNIMLLEDGTIKVMDFGIARFARDDSKTMTDKAIGSVHYISPEQASGGRIDEKTDIYSVGVMMFEMLTGQLPFEADNAVSVAIMQMQSAPKRPREINDSIPEGLEEITVRAMQKDPSKRYQSAAEMMRDIDEFKRNPSILFEYKYLSGDDGTKYFETVGAAMHASGAEETGDEEEKEKKSHTIPILAGIAGAFVVVCVVVCIILVLNGGLLSSVPEYDMPDLIGQYYDDVKDDYEFDIQIKQRETSQEYEEGQIIWQSVKEGTKVKQGAPVMVIVSKGFEGIEIPGDIVGMEEQAAIDKLVGLGVLESNIEVTYSFDDTVANGVVISTAPGKGEMLDADEKVTLYVSLGSSSTQGEVMPNVVGLTYEQAVTELQARNIASYKKEVDDASAAGTVLEQSVKAGEKVLPTDLVALTVSNGKEQSQSVTVTTPNFPSADAGNSTYYFTVYVDGIAQSSLQNVSVDISKDKNWSFTLTNTGSKTVLVTVRSSGNGTEMQYISYSVDFSTQKYTQNGSTNNSVFTKSSSSSSSSSSESESSSSSP